MGIEHSKEQENRESLLLRRFLNKLFTHLLRLAKNQTPRAMARECLMGYLNQLETTFRPENDFIWHSVRQNGTHLEDVQRKLNEIRKRTSFMVNGGKLSFKEIETIFIDSKATPSGPIKRSASGENENQLEEVRVSY